MPGGDCKHIDSCTLFPVFKVKSFMSIWKISYCQGNWSACVRYQRAERGEPIPTNLLPDGQVLGAPASAGAKGR
ncbi:MAG TPA: hypothetical protein PK668_15675 [Myxococcota bacterium]|nr:hypothetical protein [Myxococcota bacterium]HRY94335.1 hypothetical protein [Myxococcota bacterium]HSA21216.1 hypothetical protein [Myxococcota bacterium]